MRQRHVMLTGDGGQVRVDVGQRGAAVDLGLPGAEQVQVGAMDDEQPLFLARCVQDRARSMQIAGF